LLITGGEDVYPGIYGKINDTARCGSFDRYRDSLELKMIATAFENGIPLFGVCRGLQIINVALKGSLIIDIPTDYNSKVKHRQDDWQNCYHTIFPVEATNFNVICEGEPGEVASNHHQGIDKLGKKLQISAYAADSLPEAIEWDVRGEKAFLMAVQWHPERMDTLHHLSASIAKAFLLEAESFRDDKE
jgi:putative glutamine amidotransferase